MERDVVDTRQRSAVFNALHRAQRERFYISFSCAGSYLPNHKGKRAPYMRFAWPILFKTADLAWQAIHVLPVFANQGAIPGRGRIKSVCVERTMIA